MRIQLPKKILEQKDERGEIYFFNAKEIAIIFDDILMPCLIVDGIPCIEINTHPFQNLNRPDYDHLTMVVRVYDKRCQIPPVGADFTYEQQKDPAEATIDRTNFATA